MNYSILGDGLTFVVEGAGQAFVLYGVYLLLGTVL